MAQRNENSYGNKFSNKGYEYDNMKYILLAQHTHEEPIYTTYWHNIPRRNFLAQNSHQD